MNKPRMDANKPGFPTVKGCEGTRRSQSTVKEESGKLPAKHANGRENRRLRYGPAVLWWCGGICRRLSTLVPRFFHPSGPRPSTLDPRPSTLHRPSTLLLVAIVAGITACRTIEPWPPPKLDQGDWTVRQ